ncbi:MAG: hypothetical protein ACUVSX_12740 [Aggregatilineales bacterium]
MSTTNGAEDAARKADEARQQAEQAVEEIRENVEKKVAELRREAQARAEDMKREAAKQLNTAAETIRREARESGQVDADALKRIDDIAMRLEKTANYLNSRSVQDIGSDATKVVVRNPWRAVIISFVVGFLLGLMLRGDD